MTVSEKGCPIDPLAKIFAAYAANAKEWRTSFGLAEELGLPEATVEQTIREHPDVFRRATIAPAGFALYRPRRRSRKA
jgi:hypothetical protein